ncbi:MAG TPA: RagB/SusD family nutrient uptake outer membrane protein, partial [Agriterribacter sp.]|nr:RagB/SusD family nutrient uptake outer membrane protein [Agriterribacter sp.]
MKQIILYISILSASVLTGCIKEVPTSNAITDDNIVTSVENLKSAVNGGYSLFKDHLPFNGQADDNLMYLRQYFQMSDFASDDIVCGQVTEDPLFNSFTYGHTSLQTNSRYFWYVSYKMISGMNTVIAAMENQTNIDAASSQLLGECYFLRAFAHFNLAKFYALPYTTNPDGPGIILRQSIDDPSQKARSTVKEV